MFAATTKINGKEYLKMGIYYLRKYAGLKELILFVFLFVAAVVLSVISAQFWLLWVAVGTIGVFLICITVYIFLLKSGFDIEYTKRGAEKWDFTFNDGGFIVDLYENGKKTLYTEKYAYEQIEKIAIRKDRVFIYCGTALQYYILLSDVSDNKFMELTKFLEDTVPDEKFRMKRKTKFFKEKRDK